MNTLQITGTVPDIFIGYLSPVNGTIVPLTSDCTLTLMPFEESIRRLYLVSNSLSSKHIQVTISIEGAKKFSYTSKVLVGRNSPSMLDFKSASNFDGVLYEHADKNYSNGIPIDIYIKSHTNNQMPVNLVISVNTPPRLIGSNTNPILSGTINFDTTTTTVTNYPIDLLLLQDLSGSFADDIATIKTLVPSLVDGVRNIQIDTMFGVASFVDKPIDPFGSSGDYIYRLELPMTSSQDALQTTINNLTVLNGNDEPESQLEALQQVALNRGAIGFRDNAVNIVVLFTDATYHDSSSYPSGSTNNNDTIIGPSENYPDPIAVKLLLEENNIYPIFSVTSNVTSTYESLVSILGRGSVVTLTTDSSNIVSAVTTGVTNAPIKKIVLPLSGSVLNIPNGNSLELTLTDSVGYIIQATTTVSGTGTFNFGGVDFSSVSPGIVTITIVTLNDYNEPITRTVRYLYST